MANTLTYCSATKLAYRWGRRTRAINKSRQKQTWISSSKINKAKFDKGRIQKKTGNKNEVFCSLERNSSMGDAMATVAEMWVSLTIRDERSLIMISGISTVHIVRATTHCLAQRWMRPVSRHWTSSLCRRESKWLQGLPDKQTLWRYSHFGCVMVQLYSWNLSELMLMVQLLCTERQVSVTCLDCSR